MPRKPPKRATQGSAMRLRYLPVNAGWAFLFGRNIETASLITMCKTKQRVFPNRDAAVYEAERCGLTVDKQGNVEAVREDKAHKPMWPSEAARAMKTPKHLNGPRRRRRGR